MPSRLECFLHATRGNSHHQTFGLRFICPHSSRPPLLPQLPLVRPIFYHHQRRHIASHCFCHGQRCSFRHALPRTARCCTVRHAHLPGRLRFAASSPRASWDEATPASCYFSECALVDGSPDCRAHCSASNQGHDSYWMAILAHHHLWRYSIVQALS